MEKIYYVGLDMGTSSLGWAVTNENYELIRKKGKDLWGVRLFAEAETAAQRRSFRTSRRRLQREKARIGYVKELFAPEINKIDPGFYQRLEDSKYYQEDKRIQQPFALFADTGFTDKEYYEKYPTIFHLRMELLTDNKPKDARLIFMAVLNMFKHRGHFLNNNIDDKEGIGNLHELYHMMLYMASDILEIEITPIGNIELLEQILTNKELSNTGKFEEILRLHGISKSKDKQEAEIWKFVCGLSGSIAVLYPKENLDEEHRKVKLSFRDGNFEEKILDIETVLSEETYEFLMLLKQIHDVGLLINIMKGYKYLSEARVAEYEKHKKDLQVLKTLLKEQAPDEYDKMFRIMEDNNYSAYVGSVNSGKQKERRGGKHKKEDFYSYVKKVLSKLPNSEKKEYILGQIAQENFLPKQLTASNGVIPNQVHKKELSKILNNAAEYLEFLNETDEHGRTVKERIVKMFEFQIPYYVGPISSSMDGNHKNKNVWSVRKEKGAVYPWNFEEKIDVKESAEKFIERMVNHCTYLSGEKVLPKNSLLYEKFMVLNELNNLKINGEKISSKLKQEIYLELFATGKKVTAKKLESYLKVNGYVGKEDDIIISGIDGDFINRLANYGKFCEIFGVKVLNYEQERMAEKIIFWATVYGDTKSFLKEKIWEEFGEILDKNQIKRICGMRFKDWGRLSRELLELEGADVVTGEIKTVIQRMWEENYNLMELIATNEFTYKQAIEEKTKKVEKTLTEIKYEDLEEIYASAPVKRMIWQTILILREIYKVMGNEPAKIFVEMAKQPDKNKTRKASRKMKFLELYKKCKEDGRDWVDEISNIDEGEFRRKKLYLYYTQKGRCMYTGKIIEISDLFNDNLYDIDHIYPRHYVKDDSIENNLVLVKKDKNAHKSDSFPIESEIRQKQKSFWKMLRDGNFITEEKFQRLVRSSEFTENEMADFISRQIVETRQGTKLITQLLEQTFEHTEIVYVKAGNVSDFRNDKKFVKCRNVNDYHHAKDAYLNIVVGNVYHVKFTKNPYHFIRNEYSKDPQKYNYHLAKIFQYNVVRRGETAWRVEENPSIKIVEKMMRKNTPLVTKMSYEEQGGFADQTIYSAKEARKAKGVGYLPVKQLDEKLGDVCKYGGYKKFTGTYFFLVEYAEKGKRVRSLEAMPLYLKETLDTKEKLEQYCETKLKYESPSVRYPKIKMYSLIKVNGFYMYLTGRSNNALKVCNAVQLALDEKQCEYVKKITKANEEGLSDNAMKKLEISKERNLQLYEVLKEKHQKTIYAKRPNPVGDKLQEYKEKFEELDMKRQNYVLIQILQLSQLMNQGADLTEIGGAKQTGVAQINKKISGNTEFKLIHQSVTGLYEQEIDLLTV